MHFLKLYQIEQSCPGIVEFEKKHGLSYTLKFYDGFCKNELNRKRKLKCFLRDHDIMFRSNLEYYHEADTINVAEMALLHGPRVALRIYKDFCVGDKNRYRKLKALMQIVEKVSIHEDIIKNTKISGKKAALAFHKHFHPGDPNRARKLTDLMRKVEQNEFVDATDLCEKTSEHIYSSPFGSSRAKRKVQHQSLSKPDYVNDDNSSFNMLSCLATCDVVLDGK